MKRNENDELHALMEKAMAAFEAMTPWQKIQHREQQRISFVYGNLAMSTNHRVSLQNVRRAALEMWLDDLASDRSEALHAQRKLELRLIAMGLGIENSYWLSQGHDLPRG